MKKTIAAGIFLAAAVTMQAQQDTGHKKTMQHKKMTTDTANHKMNNWQKPDTMHTQPMYKPKKKIDSTAAKQ